MASPAQGCALCRISTPIGDWAQHARGKRHKAALAAAAPDQAVSNLPPAAGHAEKKSRKRAPEGSASPLPPKKIKKAAAPPTLAPPPAPAAPAAVVVAPKDDALITQARALGSEYCLAKKDLAALPFESVRNPHYSSAAPMKLFEHAVLLAAALAKHGDAAGIATAAAKRSATAAKSKTTRANKEGWRVSSNPRGMWTPTRHSLYSDPFRASMDAFALCAHRILSSKAASQSSRSMLPPHESAKDLLSRGGLVEHIVKHIKISG